MFKKFLLAVLGLVLGSLIAYAFVFYIPSLEKGSITADNPPPPPFVPAQKEIIGFLPYWLLSQSKKDYSSYITDLNYFSLAISEDGTIKKLNNPQEAEPGWNALATGIVDPYLKSAKEKGLKTSLTVFSGDQDAIANLMDDPKTNAQNLANEVGPVMKEHGFTSLNLDVEFTSEASAEARANFTAFTKELKKNMDEKGLGPLWVDVAPGAFVNKNLIDPNAVSAYVNKIIIMAYDYHFTGSYVTGPVAPLGGFGKNAEFDIKTAVEAAKAIVPQDKLILGVPLYGYEWESLSSNPRTATVPDTSIVASAKRVQDLKNNCQNCTYQYDSDAQESYVTFPDTQSQTIHQIFFPSKQSTQAKVDFTKQNKLSGIAIWALGYESSDILDPFGAYKKSLL